MLQNTCILTLLSLRVLAHGGESLIAPQATVITVPNPKVHCALPEIQKNGEHACPDQTKSIEERRNRHDEMKPFDQINGVRLDDFWPASASVHVAETQRWEQDGIKYNRYRLFRKAGERSPIHYHENAQITCLKEGRVMLFQEGEEDQIHEAPDCYLMPPHKKMSALSLTDKIEEELFHIPADGIDWVVLEPNYHHLQGQWTSPSEKETEDAEDSPKLGASFVQGCQSDQCSITDIDGSVRCVDEGFAITSYERCPGTMACLVFNDAATWVCEGTA